MSAIENNDIDEIKRCVRNLIQLIERSSDLGNNSKGAISGITK
jgi:hypothetical protein